MKKYIILLAIPFMLQKAFAQKLNKDLVFGHWTVYYVSNSQFTMHTDSTEQCISKIVKVATALAPEHRLSTEDSIKTVKEYQLLSKWIDSSFIELNKNDKFKGEFYFTDNPERPQADGGSFILQGNRLLLNGKEQTVFSVKSLTAKNLVLIINDGGKPEEVMTLKLKRR